jgi:uncharacterized surface protein with fasciclin (FAS1) repeats
MNKLLVIVPILGLVLVGGYFMVNAQNASNDGVGATSVTPAAEIEASVAPVEATNTKTIVDIAAADSNFSTLVTAVKAAGLAETLSGEGPYTVFAPTNEAFAKLPEGTVESLLQDKERLAQILTYHVVPGKVMSADVLNLTTATTVQGDNISITVEGMNVMVNDANVIKTDIEASNGVIHVIDTVLMPH